jgi:hypothetical protein
VNHTIQPTTLHPAHIDVNHGVDDLDDLDDLYGLDSLNDLNDRPVALP